jgi:hypothetical protein
MGLGSFSLRFPDYSQNAACFIRPVVTRNESGSGSDHVLCCLHCNLSTVAAIHRFEQGNGVIGVLVVVRIISHPATACTPRFVTAT